MTKQAHATQEDAVEQKDVDTLQPPDVVRAADGAIDQASLVAVIEWFLRNDPRVAIINHPRVEEVFQWKQSQRAASEAAKDEQATVAFTRAEDRLAIGIFQAAFEHNTERALHGWIGELLVAIDESTKTNEEIGEAYKLDADASPVQEAAKLPGAQERDFYLSSCWLETLCTAEARVLGWIYQSLYARPFHPNNF